MKSEVIICTNTNKLLDFIELIKYYDIIGFDKITVCDNNSPLDLNSILKPFKKVNVFKNEKLNQVELFDYTYNFSTSDWVYFADDDEFLWFDQNKYKNINDFIVKKSAELNTDNIGIYWVKVNNYNAIEKRDFNNPEHTQVKLFRYINPAYEPDSWIKGIYKTKQNINFYYIHFPTPLNNYKTVKNIIFDRPNIIQRPYDYRNDDALIFHYYFKTYAEFYEKYKISLNDYYVLIYNQQYIQKTDKIYSILYS